ncbi:MAG: haloacid dehalogenase [Desulfococcaceae bacterium]
MINPASLAFDIDGVVADTMNLFLDIVREDHGIHDVQYEHITRYMLEECLDIHPDIISDVIAKLLDGSRDAGLKPIAGARRVLTRLGKEYAPVRFVTARPNPGPISEWMQNLLQIDPARIDIVATGSFEAKTEVLREKGVSHFVEDRLETCFLLKEEGITPLVFRQPWNRVPHPFTEVGTWQELENLIAF